MNKHFFEEKFKFQVVRVEVNTHYWHTKHHFDISDGWVGLKNFVKMTCCNSNVNMVVSPNIWSRNAF